MLRFVKKTEIPLGDARWLTVVSPQQPDGHPAAKPFKEALVNDGRETIVEASRVHEEPMELDAEGESLEENRAGRDQ